MATVLSFPKDVPTTDAPPSYSAMVEIIPPPDKNDEYSAVSLNNAVNSTTSSSNNTAAHGNMFEDVAASVYSKYNTVPWSCDWWLPLRCLALPLRLSVVILMFALTLIVSVLGVSFGCFYCVLGTILGLDNGDKVGACCKVASLMAVTPYLCTFLFYDFRSYSMCAHFVTGTESEI